MSPSSNKRKYPRVEGKGVAAYLRLNGHNAGCTVQNISVGGVFVRTDRFLPVGTKLAFDLVKPGMKKALTVAGWVVGVITAELAARTKLPQGLRIQFAKMNPAASEALQELVGSLRRNPGAELPVLYPVEAKPGEARPAAASRRASGSRRSPRPAPPPPPAPPQLKASPVPPPSSRLPARAPSRALGDELPNATEVEMEARGFDAGGGPMIDDSLLDSAGEPELPDDSAADEELDQEQAADEGDAGEEYDGPLGREELEEPEGSADGEEAPPDLGPNPFDDDDRTIGAEPTQAKARYGGAGEAARRPTAARPPPSRVRPAEEEEAGGEDGGDLEELAGANRELQRLLERREEEIATLRAQVAKLEQTLKDREEQLQLAKRVLRTNGLG